MKAKELMAELFQWADADISHYEKTCDTLKAGDPDRELHRVAVAMFGTVDIIRQAHAWGADLLLVHEPLFYNHWDEAFPAPVAEAKEKLLRDSGMTVYRYHDHPHYRQPDMICAGELEFLGLTGKFENRAWAVNRITLDVPITPAQLVRRMHRKLHIDHPRLAGAADLPMTKISLCFGTPGGVFEELQDSEIEMVLTGEACEWALAEYARDAAALGFRKALIVMGHIGSERDGMRLLTDYLQEKYPVFTVRYFECGEVYR